MKPEASRHMKHRRKRQIVVCIDFDGVIHLSLNKWKGCGVVDGSLVNGTKEAISYLYEKCRVVVFSGRCCKDDGVEAIERFLQKHEIVVDEVSKVKPLADIYIDDRAIQFKGDWNKALEDVKEFKWWLTEARGKKVMRERQRRLSTNIKKGTW